MLLRRNRPGRYGVPREIDLSRRRGSVLGRNADAWVVWRLISWIPRLVTGPFHWIMESRPPETLDRPGRGFYRLPPGLD